MAELFINESQKSKLTEWYCKVLAVRQLLLLFIVSWWMEVEEEVRHQTASQSTTLLKMLMM